ncbi:hypothetical protein WDU94_007196 [Cyamophila willieti]
MMDIFTTLVSLVASIAFVHIARIYAFDFRLELPDSLVNPSFLIDNHFIAPPELGGLNTDVREHLLSRQRRYTYMEPDSVLVRQFEHHLTARDGEKSPALQDIVDTLVKECDRLSHKALNESIHRHADHNYMVHYNHTETVYRFYRQRYQDFAESLYHKLIFIMPHLVKKHMRTVFMNITSDLKVISLACMDKFQDLDDRVNTHFLSYGELFRSILIESMPTLKRISTLYSLISRRLLQMV